MPAAPSLRPRRLAAALFGWPAALRRRWCVLRHKLGAGCGVRFHGRPPVVSNRGELLLADHVAIDSRLFPVRLTVLPGARLEIGRDTFINRGTSIAAARSVRIGNHCLIGEWVSILDTDFHPVHADAPTAAAPVTIGHNVWLANRAIVLRGVTIGDHAVIGAGAVVSRDVPARAIVAGNPARVVGTVRGPADFRRGAAPALT